MAKINLNGEWFDFDFERKPMSEALALEKATGQRYADWEMELAAGSAEAMCGLVWLVWRRNGREVPLADILSGAAEVDLVPLLDSLKVVADEQAAAQEDPTGPGVPPGRTPVTPPGTRQSSRRSTGSARGRSGS